MQFRKMPSVGTHDEWINPAELFPVGDQDINVGLFFAKPTENLRNAGRKIK